MKSSTPQNPHLDAPASTIGEQDSFAALGEENARLVALLESHGIAWRLPPEPTPPVPESAPSHFSAEAKVALFRRLFRGRTDVLKFHRFSVRNIKGWLTKPPLYIAFMPP